MILLQKKTCLLSIRIGIPISTSELGYEHPEKKDYAPMPFFFGYGAYTTTSGSRAVGTSGVR